MKKFAVCSDIGLESRFRRMSSQKIEQYHEDLLKNFYKLRDILLDEKPNFLFILGNLFGKVKPSNASLNAVLNCFTQLTDKKIDIFILPGNLETPLFTIKDVHALEIYRNNPRIHIIYDNHFRLEDRQKVITNAYFDKKVQGIDFKIYSTPNPLIPPNKLDYRLDVSDEACELFLLGDLTAFKKKQDQEKIPETLKNLDQNPLTAIFIGGNIPNDIDLSKIENQFIHCPQINANNFDFAKTISTTETIPAKYPCGIKLLDYDPTDQSFSNIHVIPVSDLEMDKIMINLNTLKPKKWDDTIKKSLQINSKIKKFTRLQLEGKVSRDLYHKYLSIYRFFDIGRVRNYHFELEDRIEFENASEDISDLRVMDELRNYKNKRVEDLLNGDLEGENTSNIESIYNTALKNIEMKYKGEEIE